MPFELFARVSQDEGLAEPVSDVFGNEYRRCNYFSKTEPALIWGFLFSLSLFCTLRPTACLPLLLRARSNCCY